MSKLPGKGTNNHVSRREVLVLGTGYALAVSPVTAWALSTPADGLHTAEVTIPSQGSPAQAIPAYLARPQKAGSYPVVIVVHEIFGVHEYIKDVCRRFAKQGYLAISPYLYAREGDATKVADISKLLADIVNKVPQEQVMNDLDSVVAWLAKQKEADVTRTAITGFCWGGSITWLYAARNAKLKAAVAWYGRLNPTPTTLQPQAPLAVAASLQVPVLGLYGEKDSGIPLSDVESMRQALAKGKSGSEIIVFPGAEHGFHADYRPSYHAKAAAEGWDKALQWLRGHGMS